MDEVIDITRRIEGAVVAGEPWNRDHDQPGIAIDFREVADSRPPGGLLVWRQNGAARQ